ncbi:hypothetical protein [Vampirovibrio sp.]|uniref:hypothetical protein n=1 Tax=Vampirovibrio sp. TaxID=2717857 RepID=UPI0035936405
MPKLVVGTVLLAAGLAIKAFALATVLAAPILVPVGLGLGMVGALLMGWGGVQAYKQSNSKPPSDDPQDSSASNAQPDGPSDNATPPTPEITADSATPLSEDQPESHPPTAPSQGSEAASPVSAPAVPQNQDALSFEALYGTNDIRQIFFKQKSGTLSCYLLAALDSLMQHPAGRQALEKIQVYRTANGYDVKFPGQPNPIPVSNAELADRMAEGPLGIRLIEKAYLKTPGATLLTDNPTSAIERIFGWQQSKTEAIKLQNNPGAKQFIGGIQFSFRKRAKQFKEYVAQLPHTREFGNVDTWSALKKNGGNHWYSLRFDSEDPDSVIKVNPEDTQRLVERITIDELLDQCHLEGARIPI